jgi:branched-chain amino acid transport system substrate-binding protein
VRQPSPMTAAMLAVAAALMSALPANAAGTVKIGILWPLTGNAAAAGQASKAAAEVAADIVNNKHPELGNLPLAATGGLPNQGGAKLELARPATCNAPDHARQCACADGRVSIVLQLYGNGSG